MFHASRDWAQKFKEDEMRNATLAPPPSESEYAVYAKVLDLPMPQTVQALTPDDLIDRSDCTYQSMWMDEIRDSLKAGLLLCKDKFNVESHDGWTIDRHSVNSGRAMFLILCEAGVTHYKCDDGNGGRSIKWIEDDESMRPGNAIYLGFNMEHLFITTQNKAVQLKVVDLRPFMP